ncbi:hypothetical protein A3844_26920 [Paenibacillus helianthi]|uniref:ABC transporter ATP-binding protein n=1 Tax=Paenibacillus helianthi TaxID=1349432 RepID=A0ABX3EJL0_9BACL|nr:MULTISPECIES: ABC transporter ATP-binding protein [Paenibacillus]OKP80718.1 hypothetical protein A3844_26920 [Paenibacillus helianthi]OKP89128.1 hypothetical protein A3848_16630 [Paenibacillus sp. P32E]
MWRVYWWALSFVKPYILILSLLICSYFLLSSAELFIPKYIQYFVDVIFPAKDYSKFSLFIFVLIGVIVVILAAKMMQNTLSRHLQEKAAKDIQFAVFQHLRKLGFAYYEQNPVGRTLSLLNTEVASMQSLYRQYFPVLIEGLIFSFISAVMMLSTSLHLSVIVLPSFLLYYVFGPMLERKAAIHGKNMSQARIDENQKVYESISASLELRAYESETWEIGRYEQKVKLYNASMIKAYWYAYLRGTNRRITYNIGGIAIFVYGNFLFGHSQLSIGEFISFILYYFTVMHRLTAVVTNITEQRLLMHQAERLYSFLRSEPSLVEASNPVGLMPVKGDIRLDNVCFTYNSGQSVLNGLNLSIAAGERVAIVGKSGNGKTTILKLIGRFYDPDNGSIFIDNVPLRDISFSSLRMAMGYVFQDTYVFGSTVTENIKFGKPDATQEEVVRAAKAAYAHDFILNLQDGYDTQIGERGVNLSGGQRQRIAIARMFIHDPAIILLDEATSALDNTSEIQVFKAMNELFKGRTIIAVAHRLSTIKDFDRFVVIEAGIVVENGSYAELLALGGAFSTLAASRGTEASGG